ncbi:MAG: sugar phosphate isomerase/epimerase family protein [Armatimonadota bacterium]|nr:sugar phosphate isomerase/epimerase [bacterium]
MKPGIASISLRKYDIFHALDLAAETGFMGVEISARPPHMPDEFDEYHTKLVRERLCSNHLAVPMVGSYARPCLPDFEQKSADAIKIAKILGARVIRIWAGNREPYEASPEFRDLVVKSIREFALRAEYAGMSLAVEMHAGTLCSIPEGVLRLIEQANVPNIKVNFQVVNFLEPDLDRYIGMLGDYVVNVHAQNYKPSSVQPGKLETCWIEDGLVDYDHLLSLLSQHSFDGYVEAEFLKGEHLCECSMLESLKRDANYLRKLTAKHTR